MRLGRPKALLDFGGRPALSILLDACRAAGCGAPVVVLGAEAETVSAAAFGATAGPTGVEPEARHGFVIHGGWATGRTGSLKAGLRELTRADRGRAPGWETFLICPVDHPLVLPATIAMLIQAWQRRRKADAHPAAAVVIPAREGRRGHPVLCSRELADEFLALGDDEPARSVTLRDPARVLTVEVGDPAIHENLDTPEAYERALARWRSTFPSTC